jgi:hypothetical protein
MRHSLATFVSIPSLVQVLSIIRPNQVTQHTTSSVQHYVCYKLMGATALLQQVLEPFPLQLLSPNCSAMGLQDAQLLRQMSCALQRTTGVPLTCATLRPFWCVQHGTVHAMGASCLMAPPGTLKLPPATVLNSTASAPTSGW